MHSPFQPHSEDFLDSNHGSLTAMKHLAGFETLQFRDSNGEALSQVSLASSKLRKDVRYTVALVVLVRAESKSPFKRQL
jgi:hypothetical protein